ncbi:MAG: hypothetical protein JWM19_5131 [Actinomycetia bacterium]|nr:hypothetical protein [Actinomycetes bacterium]
MVSNTDSDQPGDYDSDGWDKPGLDDGGLVDDGDYDQYGYDVDGYDQDGYDQDAPDQDGRYRDPEYYWRRRFLVLAGGLAIVGVIACGVSALLGPAKPVRAAHASLAVRDTLPPAALGSPPATSGSSPSVRAAAAPGKGSSPAPGASSRSAPSVTGSPSQRSSASPAATCSPSAMVLSLLTPHAQYSPEQQPRFEVYAVSTAPGSCALAFGPSTVQVVVVHDGHVLWDSAGCLASTPAAKPVRFMQGVPQVAVLSWNRKARTSGCAGSVPAGTWGRVDAVALADGKYSPVRSFTLSR